MVEAASAVAEGTLAADRHAQNARIVVHRLNTVRQDYEYESAMLIDRIAKLEEAQMQALFELRQMHRKAGLTWDQATECLIRDLEMLSRALNRPKRARRQPGQPALLAG